MRVRFWGTRGSIARPGPSTLRYGGNTSCVELRADDGTLVVLDCGTGAHELGLALRSEGPRCGHLLIGHTHWDHIQGFPFFGPFFVPGDEWRVYAPGGGSSHIEATLSAQMSYDYHPITVSSLEAGVRFHDLTEGEFQVGGVRVVTQYLHHPALTLGYRLEADGVVVVYASDHEPHSLHPLDASPGETPIHHEDRRHMRFIEGADLLIHDAQYALEAFPEKSGWGHTPWERAVDYAIGARAARLALFHHDPESTDDDVDRIQAAARARAARATPGPEVFAAAEGSALELRRAASDAPAPLAAPGSALLAAGPAPDTAVLIVEDDRALAAEMRRALEPEHRRLLLAGDGPTALAVARAEHPSLVVLDLGLPGPNGLEVCRLLREDSDPRLRDVPILILTGSQLDERVVVEAFVAGATDFLEKPIKPTLLRSRVRGWLMRFRPPRAEPTGA